jgi:hypothetical protein
LIEAKPHFGLIASLPDQNFMRACAPTLTMEEFNVFKESIQKQYSVKRNFSCFAVFIAYYVDPFILHSMLRIRIRDPVLF